MEIGAYFNVNRSLSEEDYRNSHCEASYGHPGAQPLTCRNGESPSQSFKERSKFWKTREK